MFKFFRQPLKISLFGDLIHGDKCSYFPMSVTSLLSNSCVEMLMPYMTLLGAVCVGWVCFGKCFGHEGGNLLAGITALMKKALGAL